MNRHGGWFIPASTHSADSADTQKPHSQEPLNEISNHPRKGEQTMTTFIRNTKMWAAAALTTLFLGTAGLASASPAATEAAQRSEVVAVSTERV